MSSPGRIEWPAVFLYGIVLLAFVYAIGPTYDFSAEVLFDTKSFKSVGRQYGVIRYGTDGYRWEIKLRESDAQHEMTSICAPHPYDVIDVKRVVDSSAVSIGGHSFSISEPSMLMEFNCLTK